MRDSKSLTKFLLAIPALVGAVLLLSGCPANFGLDKAQLTTVFTADGAPLANAVKFALKGDGGGVPLEEIERLDVTITKVRVHLAGEDDDTGDPEDSKDGADDGGSWITLFPNADGETLRVNLVDLTDVNQVLTVDELPAGTINKVELSIVDPELVLVSTSPDPVEAEIKTTANGRLFVSTEFTLEPGSMGILQLDFGGIHLVKTGNGKYVLTPQLRAEVGLLSAEDTMITGEVQNLDPANDYLEVVFDGVVVQVDCADAMVYLPEDTDTPNGSKADLANGQMVEVEGRLYADNSMTAMTIRILPEPEPAEPDPGEEPTEEPFTKLGTATLIDSASQTFTLVNGESHVVDYSQATIGGFGLLVENALVQVDGMLVTDSTGSIVLAESIQVIAIL